MPTGAQRVRGRRARWDELIALRSSDPGGLRGGDG